MQKKPQNNLFPVFLKLEKLNLLVVGGGAIALEKLTAIRDNSPSTTIKLIAITISEEIKILANDLPNIQLIEKEYDESDFDNVQIAIAAVGDITLSERIKKDAIKKGVLLNAADKPILCDFYLGSIVQKGDLKIAISTNGKSPTMAKRVKEILNEVFPEETQEVLENLYKIRESLRGNFDYKVKTLNKLTKDYVLPKEKKTLDSKIIKAAIYSFGVILLMLLGHIIFSYIPLNEIGQLLVSNLDSELLLYMFGGFIAQMIDGALGMAYGVSVTTFLLSLGIPSITPAVASASMHTSEIFTTGSSSLVYMRYKNINIKLFKALLWPGIIGTIIGATVVSFVSKDNISIIKPIVALYTLTLGVLIILRALKINLRNNNKIKQIFPVAFFGGFLDSVGGGGWGPIVTTSLVAGGRNLRYAIGSSHLAKFFVALVSTITFSFIIGISHWKIIFGLVIGSMIAAPISIYLSNKIPIKKGLILVGSLVIIISLKTIIQTLIK